MFMLRVGGSPAALASDLEGGGRKVTIRDRLGQNTVVAKATSTTGRVGVGSSSATMVRLAPPTTAAAVRAKSATVPARTIATARRSLQQPATAATSGRLAGRLGQVNLAGQQAAQSAGVLGQAAAVMARSKPAAKPSTMIRTSATSAVAGGSSLSARLGSGSRPVNLVSTQSNTSKSLASRLGTKGELGASFRPTLFYLFYSPQFATIAIEIKFVMQLCLQVQLAFKHVLVFDNRVPGYHI